MSPNNVLSVADIRKALEDRRLALVSSETGLHYNTLKEIRDGRSTDPRYSTMLTLTKYLEGRA